MSRQLEQAQEVRSRKLADELAAACDYGLEGAVAHAGGVLEGFSVRYGGADVLVTLRVVLAGRRQIAFVGAESLGAALRKVVWLARSDSLKFKPDRFAE